MEKNSGYTGYSQYHILTQLAIISDLLENAHLSSEGSNIIFMVSEDEFDRLFHLIIKRANLNLNKVDDTFSVKIGTVEYVFTVNKSNA